MPNWCSNTVVVRGDAKDMKKFNKWLGDGKGLLSKIKPTPKPLINTVSGFIGDPVEQAKLEKKQKANLKKYGAKDWYDWNISNWGTKWDVDADVDESSSTDGEVVMSFESAWSPPQVAISELSVKFPKLTVRHSYMEEGVCFVGFDELKNGEVLNQNYNEDPKTEAWKHLAREEFGWEPWEDDEEVEASKE
jgi:hypothetical protein